MKRKSLCLLYSLVLLIFIPISALAQVERKVAVFDPAGSVEKALLEIVREEISSVVVNTTGYTVLERQLINKVLEENKFQESGLVNDEQVSDIGKRMGADYVFVTTISPLGGNYYISCKMIEVATARIDKQSTGTTTAGINDIPQTTQYIVKSLFGENVQQPVVNRQSQQADRPVQTTTPQTGATVTSRQSETFDNNWNNTKFARIELIFVEGGMLPEKEMNLLSPGKMMTEVLHSKRNGFLHFGGGMSTNLMGDFGYHLLNNDCNLLDVWYSHRSLSGNVEFEFEEEGFDKRKAKINDNLGGLDFKHRFDKATFSLGGKFGYSAFNYYGIPTNMIPEYDPLSSGFYPYITDITTNQGNRLINVFSSVTSHFPYSYGYHFGAEYTNFNQKYWLSKDLDGMTENHIAVDFDLSSPVNNGKSFGVDVKANILTYTAPWVVSIDSAAFNAHVNATLNPYYRFESDTWKLLLGVNLMLVSQNDEINFFASPNITLDVPFAIRSLFYANLGGGIESNSMAYLSRTNRYINPTFTADASKTWADLKLGVRSTATTGFWFDFFAGYKYTESDIFFNPSWAGWINEGFNNFSMIFQPTTQRIQVGATLKYDYQHIVDFYIKGVYDYYILKYAETWKNEMAIPEVNELKPFGKPSFTANAGLNALLVKPLKFTLDYCMMSGMYARFPDSLPTSTSERRGDVKMKAINDLRFCTSWKFNDTFSIYAQFNNLLFQKQSLYYGYSLQPFTAMGGFNINF